MSDYTINVGWSGKDALDDDAAGKVISGADFNTEFTTIATAINSKADTAGDATESFAMLNGTVAGTLAITGVPTGPTQSAGNNTTRLATTAFVTTAAAALNAAAYPVGSIFTTTVAYANSAAVVTAIGGVNWEAFGKGRILIGAGTTAVGANAVASDADAQVVVITKVVNTKKYKILSLGTSNNFAAIGATVTPAIGVVFVANSTTGTGDATVAEVQDFTAGAIGGEFNHTLTTGEIPAHTHPIDVATRNTSVVDSNTIHDPSFGSAGVTTRPTNNNTGGDGTHNNLQPYIVVYMWLRLAD